MSPSVIYAGIGPVPCKMGKPESQLDSQHSNPTWHSFPQLSSELQSLILAWVGAPLNTCRASLAVLKDAHMAAAWMIASDRLSPLLRACRLMRWDVCSQLLGNNRQYNYTPTQYQLCFALSEAAEQGQLELVNMLISQGAWDATCHFTRSPLNLRL
jgi:hypothetical protein